MIPLIVALLVVTLIAVGLIMLVLGKQAKKSEPYIQARQSIQKMNSKKHNKSTRSTRNNNQTTVINDTSSHES